MTTGLLIITYTAGFLTALLYTAALEYAHGVDGILTRVITHD